MKILVPVLCGREGESQFVEAITDKVDEVVLLQIVDKEFHSRAGSAVGEVRTFRVVLDALKKAIGQKRKKCVELTEWGATIQKIVSIAVLQKVDAVFLVSQRNQFYHSIISELKKKRVAVEEVFLPEAVESEGKKKRGLW